MPAQPPTPTQTPSPTSTPRITPNLTPSPTSTPRITATKTRPELYPGLPLCTSRLQRPAALSGVGGGKCHAQQQLPRGRRGKLRKHKVRWLHICTLHTYTQSAICSICLYKYVVHICIHTCIFTLSCPNHQ